MADIGDPKVIVLPRRYALGDVVEVKTRLSHPQENGRRELKGGGYAAAHYVTEIRVLYGGEAVLTMASTAGMSPNPIFNFKLRLSKAAPLVVEWKDNRGGAFSAAVDIRG